MKFGVTDSGYPVGKNESMTLVLSLPHDSCERLPTSCCLGFSLEMISLATLSTPGERVEEEEEEEEEVEEVGEVGEVGDGDVVGEAEAAALTKKTSH